MKQLSQWAPMRHLSDCLGRLSRYELRLSSSTSLSLYADEDAAKPEHSHTTSCTLRQNLWKMIALCAAFALLWALIRKICSWLSPS